MEMMFELIVTLVIVQPANELGEIVVISKLFDISMAPLEQAKDGVILFTQPVLTIEQANAVPDHTALSKAAGM